METTADGARTAADIGRPFFDFSAFSEFGACDC